MQTCWWPTYRAEICVANYISLLIVYNCCVPWLYVYIDIYKLKLCIIDLTQRGCHTLRLHRACINIWSIYLCLDFLITLKKKTKKIYIYIYIYQLEEGKFLFKVPEIQVANNSPHVTQTSVSLSGSQRLFTFCCTGSYQYRTK